MDTILVSPELPKNFGGRPQRVGQICVAEEHVAIFMGYDGISRKIAITKTDLEKVIESLGGSYQIDFSFKELEERKINFAKLASKFVPKSLKEAIVNNC